MAVYDIWWQGEGEVLCATYEAKNHSQARRLAVKQIVVRKRPYPNALDGKNSYEQKKEDGIPPNSKELGILPTIL